jgi:hypothetical protein
LRPSVARPIVAIVERIDGNALASFDPRPDRTGSSAACLEPPAPDPAVLRQ